MTEEIFSNMADEPSKYLDPCVDLAFLLGIL